LKKIAGEVWDRLPMKQVVNNAMKTNDTHWDYQVDPSASTQFIRS
jgi:choline-sulfatase